MTRNAEIKGRGSMSTYTTGTTRTEKLRWKLWGLVTRSRRVCPANAHLVILGGEKLLGRDRQTLRPDWGCREGVARCGSCWCGKLRAEEQP